MLRRFSPEARKKGLRGRCPSATPSRTRVKVQRPPPIADCDRPRSRAAVRAGRPCLYRGEKIFEPCAERAAAVSHERDYLHVRRGSARSPPRLRARARGGPPSQDRSVAFAERRWSPPTGVSLLEDAIPAWETAAILWHLTRIVRRPGGAMAVSGSKRN